ncbi:QacE family quaternary ammonium compound efflux SMR transporter [Nocardioides marmoriginsengisoli]|uniref:QacE family quaternary ammonium compound efflux SMR transporter n=1 Tax=Nocardioides marmoriginsengisoli TaxID=661483 RepID=A0A3N0CDW3_9ACTN|nr:SMR family transporter [Nocardioides marmoriginsengisoli]RNL61193.1 QacE family quaternary ammonium compound efflux SMR transporter [Nocardioides marmoriginsengisoli]
MWGATLLLAGAIGIEVAATSLLPRAESFTDPFWTAIVVGGYVVSLWMLAVVVRSIPVSVAYAAWAGAGTATVAVIGFAFLGESMTWLKGASLGLIVVGVVGLNLVASHP